MVLSTGFAGLVLFLSHSFITTSYALPAELNNLNYNADVTPGPARLPYSLEKRDNLTSDGNTTTIPGTNLPTTAPSSIPPIISSEVVSSNITSVLSSTDPINIPSETPILSNATEIVPSSVSESSPQSTGEIEPTSTPDSEPSSTPDSEPSSTPEGDPTTTPDSDPTTTPDSDPTTTPDSDPTTTPDNDPTTSPADESSSAVETGESSPSNTPTGNPESSAGSSPGSTPTDIPGSTAGSSPGSTPTDVPQTTGTDPPGTTGAPIPTIPFGISTTVISGTTYSLTYVATTATEDTTVVLSNDQTTTTATYTDGAPIWFIPVTPPGFPLPPPPPPPVGPPPAPGGGGGGGEGGCKFGCEDNPDPNNPENSQQPSNTEEPQTTEAPSSVSSEEPSSSSSESSSSSSSSAGLFCEVGCSLCDLRRHIAAPTATPELPKRSIKDLMRHARNSLVERNIPGEDSDGIAETYSEVASSGNTLTVELADGPVPGNAVARQGISSSQFTPFDDNEHNIYVNGLEGCTSVIVVSRFGAWASHFWERPAFTSGDAKFQADVLDYLHSELDDKVEFTSDIENTKVFIMTPAPESSDLNGNSGGSPSNGNNPRKYGTLVGRIETELGQIMSGVAIEPFVYQVQRNEVALRAGAWGKAMILYSNKQDVDPDPQGMFDEWKPARHAYQVWTQAKLIGHDDWSPCDGGSGDRKRQDSCPINQSSATPSSTEVPNSSTGVPETETPTPSSAGPSSVEPSEPITTAIPSSSVGSTLVTVPSLTSTEQPESTETATEEPQPTETETATEEPPVDPLPTSVPPSDFNCDCNENGCSEDSMPCCGNGSCECHCNENGCDSEDPTCCYNGTCGPLPMMFRAM